jgi:hypothetical protein
MQTSEMPLTRPSLRSGLPSPRFFSGERDQTASGGGPVN